MGGRKDVVSVGFFYKGTTGVKHFVTLLTPNKFNYSILNV